MFMHLKKNSVTNELTNFRAWFGCKVSIATFVAGIDWDTEIAAFSPADPD